MIIMLTVVHGICPMDALAEQQNRSQDRSLSCVPAMTTPRGTQEQVEADSAQLQIPPLSRYGGLINACPFASNALLSLMPMSSLFCWAIRTCLRYVRDHHSCQDKDIAGQCFPIFFAPRGLTDIRIVLHLELSSHAARLQIVLLLTGHTNRIVFTREATLRDLSMSFCMIRLTPQYSALWDHK